MKPNGRANALRAPRAHPSDQARSGLGAPRFARLSQERIYGSRRFLALTRNLELAADAPTKFVATVKAAGDVVI